MTGSISEYHQPGASAAKTQRLHYAVLGTVCALVIGIYVWSARPGAIEQSAGGAPGNYYNLLVQGIRAGQLNVNKPVPPDLARITVPYDPAINAAERFPLHDLKWAELHGLHDLSYYRGKLYLYFGATPALVLFWPHLAVTGHYLLEKVATVIFFSVGLLACAGLLWTLWRRCFADVSVGMVIAATFALGLAGFIPLILLSAEVYEVPIGCGYALTMITLVLLWQAMQAGRGRVWWLASASLTYGLALGARPSLLLGAIVLLVPVAQVWREKQRVGVLLLAATGPIALIGLGLTLYNALRFGNPLEFGQNYQLPITRHQQFSATFLWFNFRVAFLELGRWSVHFPFVHAVTPPTLPKDYFMVWKPFGFLTNIPLVWLGLAAPLACRSRLLEACPSLRWFLVAVTLLFGACALPLALHDSMCLRYEVEFASTLVLLAVVGIFSAERALASQPVWHRAVRWGWGLPVAFSVSFNLLVMVDQASESCVCRGVAALQQGQLGEAAAQFQEALKLQPDNAKAHNSLGSVLCQQGKVPEGIWHLEEALRLKPDDAETHNNMGVTMFQLGRVADAIAHCEQALLIRPDLANAHYNLGTALTQQGRLPEAIGHLERAVQLKPDYAQAHNGLACALFELSRVPEAMEHYEQALRLEPDFAAAHFYFAKALFRLGNVAQAIGHYEQAVRFKPEDANARNHLAWALATCADESLRDGARAVDQAERANQFAGDRNPAMLDTLAAAYAEVGRYNDAVRTAQEAREMAKGAGQADQARRIEGRLRLYEAGRAYHELKASAP